MPATSGPGVLPACGGQRSGAPRTSRARAIVTVVVGLAATGVLTGGLWAWIAPPVHGVVVLTRAGERVDTYLGNEADHFFVAAFLMLGLLGVVAVVTPVLVWQWKAHRGPGMVVALSAGLAAAAALSTLAGAVLVHQHYGTVDIAGAPVTAGDRVDYFTQAPPAFFGHTTLQIIATLLLPAGVAALVYAALAVSTTRDDLGGYPPAGPFDLGVPPAYGGEETALPVSPGASSVIADGDAPSGR